MSNLLLRVYFLMHSQHETSHFSTASCMWNRWNKLKPGGRLDHDLIKSTELFSNAQHPTQLSWVVHHHTAEMRIKQDSSSSNCSRSANKYQAKWIHFGNGQMPSSWRRQKIELNVINIDYQTGQWNWLLGGRGRRRLESLHMCTQTSVLCRKLIDCDFFRTIFF